MNLHDLKLKARALFRSNRAERDLHDELAFHIEREAKKLIDGGMSPADARAAAQARFGSAAAVADACRDQRGTAPIDNTIRDIQYALRTFRRAPLSAITIVVTVSIGLGVVAMLFTILNTFIFRVDTVPDIHEMYAVERPRLPNGDRSQLTRPRYDALRRETAVFTDAYAALPDIDVRVDGRMMAIALVTANFFDIIGLNPVIGRAIEPEDEARGHAVIVLSDKGWDRHFRRDPNVLGRQVLVRGVPFEIIGVMPPGFRGLEVSAPDFWGPLSQLGVFRPGHRGNEDKVGLDIIGRLRAGVTPDSALDQLAAWDSNLPAATAVDSGRGVANIALVPRRGTLPQPMEMIAGFVPLFMAFGLILLIGCANVANLLLARGVARQREIGIRLSLGASRPRIVRQLMTESVLLALAAAAGGFLVSRLGLGQTVYWVTRAMPVDVGDITLNVPAADWRVAAFLVVAAIAATAFFALMPALKATRIAPVRTLRGELIKDARPGRARNLLIGVQVFASALLLICATIFLRSAIASSQVDMGFRTADTMLIEVVNQEKRAAMLQQIAADPTVRGHAAVRPGMPFDQRDGFAEIGRDRTAVGYKFVSGDYFGVMGIPILRGRAFTAAERDDHPVAVVAESTARELFPGADAIGQTFRLEADPTAENQPRDEPRLSRVVTVVGVSRDISGLRFMNRRQPGVYLPTSLDAPKTDVMVRAAGEPDLARQAILEGLTAIDPSMGMIVTMRTVSRLEQLFLSIAFWVSLVLGVLALLLTVSGLFSVLSYLVEQRTREIGVRMALGASSQNVTRLILAQTTRPVAYGLIAGAGLAAALATVLLATDLGAFVSRVINVIDPVAYAVSVVVIVAACMAAAWIPASRAARVDPMMTLRQE